MTDAVTLPLPVPRLAVIVFWPATLEWSAVENVPEVVVLPFARANVSPTMPVANATAAPGTRLAYWSYATNATTVVAKLSAVKLFGDAFRVDNSALGAPATKVTLALSAAVPAFARMVFASARVVVIAVVATPLALLLVAAVGSTSLPLLLVNSTFWPDTMLANRSRSTSVAVAAEAPFAMRPFGEMLKVDSVALAEPAVELKVADTLPLPAPSCATISLVCAMVLRRVVASVPVASVLPPLTPNVSPLPVLANVTGA